MISEDLEVLKSIDAKLGALLVLALFDHLPEGAPARKRTIDATLVAVGLSVNEVADLLGKTTQAVYKQLPDAPKEKTRKPKSKAPKPKKADSR